MGPASDRAAQSGGARPHRARVARARLWRRRAAQTLAAAAEGGAAPQTAARAVHAPAGGKRSAAADRPRFPDGTAPAAAEPPAGVTESLWMWPSSVVHIAVARSLAHRRALPGPPPSAQKRHSLATRPAPPPTLRAPLSHTAQRTRSSATQLSQTLGSGLLARTTHRRRPLGTDSPRLGAGGRSRLTRRPAPGDADGR